MRGSNFVKLSGVVLIAIFLALGGLGGSIAARPLAQATAVATVASPAQTAIATTVATASTSGSDTTAATAVATTSAAGTAAVPGTEAATSATPFLPCPPAVAATANAQSTTAATLATVDANATAAATVSANTGYIGIRVEAVDSCGVKIDEILPNSPATAAQLQVGDVIVGADGTPITGLASMRAIIFSRQVGDKIKLTYQRSGSETTVEITLAPRPADFPATAVLPAASTAVATAAVSVSGTTSATMAATQ